MTRLRVFLSRLRALVRARAIDRDLHEQIDGHLAEAIEDYVRQGLYPEQARHEALRSFGGIARAQEAHRDIRSFGWLDDARRDVRYALRSLVRTPGLPVVSILTLALATGAASAIFSVMPTFVITVVTIAATALVAAWIPARRAAHIDPVTALRAE